MSGVTAQHSSDSAEHGTSPEFIELAHATFEGPPDVDPASSAEWNRLVRARRFITKRENGLRTPWFEGAPIPLALSKAAPAPGGCRTLMVNPPGERSGKLVAAFWIATAGYFALGWATSAIWIGFNVEQLARLQRVGARSHPLEHYTLVPAHREGYRPSPHALATADQPPHASFVTLLSRSAREIETFVSLGSRLGHVTNNTRRP